MRIKISQKRNPVFDHWVNGLTGYLKNHKRLLLLIVMVLYSLLLFLAGILVHKTEVIEEKIKPAIKKKRVFLKHWTKGKFLAKPEHIIIDIKHTDFQKIEYKRQEALEINKLIA
ncbi:MAG: hypothetical protein KAV18_01230, partial [Candidatus Omnitrophica bacterium]|nr:hypothetical protein [Candidatus Omnitrophota bacterium]